ncbi:ROK family protein [Nocardioides limicola]|uniref:ROK family protein n=1 Tax=Nocardioides limicola TaxID=2803368 RepID=UPI00193B950B|nr:ROK family protein [Nocardioides sp. DJM-14]
MERTTTAGDLLQLIRAGQVVTRADLQRHTGLSRTAITSRLAALADLGLLTEAESTATGGRPAGRLRFSPGAGLVLAGAIGRSRIQLAVCDLDGTALVSSSHDHEVSAGADAAMQFVGDEFAALLAQLSPGGQDQGRIWGVGLSIPGVVDIDKGASVDSPVLAGWDGIPLAPYLQHVTSAPVVVGSDCQALAVSERDGHLREVRDLLAVKASTGFGLGVVVDGRLVRGHRGGAGEIGHVKVDAAAGLPCRCGDSGCVEAIAAGWALVQQLRARGDDVAHVREVVARAQTGDAEARALLRESARRLGEVLADAVTLLNPEAVVVAGDMGAAFDVYAAGLRESLYSRASALATRDLKLLPATHGERAGLVGCARLALDQVLAPAAIDALLTR